MKTLIIILGPGASGKSTLTRQLCGLDTPFDEHQVIFSVNGEEERAKYTLFPEKRVAIAGNYKNGSDSISNMEARAELISCLLERNDVDYVITDGVRSSKKWDVDWVALKFKDQVAVTYVYINLPLEENLARLARRREANGKMGMDQKTIDNVLAFRSRAEGVWKAAQSYTAGPHTFVEITDEDPVKAANKVRRSITLLQLAIENAQRFQQA